MAGVSATGPYFLIGAAPVAQLLFGEGTVSLECGTEYDRRHLGLRVKRVWAAIALGDRAAGEQQRRHDNNEFSHGSLDIDMRNKARERRRKTRAPAQSDVRELEEVGRGRPAERRAAGTARRRTVRWRPW
jgi:hypothetical protein